MFKLYIYTLHYIFILIIYILKGGTAMKNLILKIDEELHKQIKIRASENGQTIKGYITTLIKRDLGIKKDIRK